MEKNIYRDSWDLKPHNHQDFRIMHVEANSKNTTIEIKAIRPKDFSGSISVSLRRGVWESRTFSLKMRNGYLKVNLLSGFGDFDFNWLKLEIALDPALFEVNLFSEQQTSVFFN